MHGPGYRGVNWLVFKGRTVVANSQPGRLLPLTHVHYTDAHFVAYRNSTRCRLLKRQAADAKSLALVHDYDTVPHLPWTPESWADFEDRLAHIPADSWMHRWDAFYATPRGARFIYMLPKPLRPTEAERHHRAMVAASAKLGLPFDRQCSDWTRLFRCPYVVRDGVRISSDVRFRDETR